MSKEVGKMVAEQLKEHIDKTINRKIQEKRYTYTMTTPNGSIWKDDNWDMWRNQYGHYNARCSFTATDDKKVKSMGLRIKKTDEMTVDEFKENTKAYDIIKLVIDKEKFDGFKKDYGKEPFNVSGTEVYSVQITGGTIEFKEKAIKFDGSWHNQIVPYSFITKVVGIYHLTTGDD